MRQWLDGPTMKGGLGVAQEQETRIITGFHPTAPVKLARPNIDAQYVKMHESNHLDRRNELVLMDPKNPRSLVNLVPEAMAQQMRNLWQSEDASSLLGLNEQSLLRELARRKQTPGPLDYKIRCKFWIEYDQVQSYSQVEPIHMPRVLGHDFPKESFYKFYLPHLEKLAFLICPPQDYQTALDMVLTQSTVRLLDIINADLFFDGRINETLAKKVMEINADMHRRKLAFEFRGRGGTGSKKQEADEPVTAPIRLPETPEEAKKRLADLIANRNKVPGQA